MITIEGKDALVKRITTLAEFRKVKDGVRQATIFLRGKIAKYPRVSRRPNMALRGNSPEAQRMRRGFFYHMKHGDITVPYRRGQAVNSQKLGQSWTRTIENHGMRGVIGTNVGYAPLVQDADRQAVYHQTTGWMTVQKVEQLHSAEAIQIIRKALEEEVKG